MEARDDPREHRPRVRPRPIEDGDRRARRGVSRRGAARRAAPLHQALPVQYGRRLPPMDGARMAHPRAAGGPRHRAGARRRAVRPRRRRPARAGADLRRRRDGRPLGHAAAGGARRRDAAPCVRGLRALVGAGAARADRARRDPRAAARAPGPQGRQRLHSLRPGGLRSVAAGAGAAPAVRADRLDRLCVLAGVGRAAADGAADRPPGRLRVPVAAAARRAGSRAARQPAADAAARLALRRVQPRGDAAALPARAGGRPPRGLVRSAAGHGLVVGSAARRCA